MTINRYLTCRMLFTNHRYFINYTHIAYITNKEDFACLTHIIPVTSVWMNAVTAPSLAIARRVLTSKNVTNFYIQPFESPQNAHKPVPIAVLNVPLKKHA